MYVAPVILSVLLLVALLRAGVIIEYNKDGLALWLKIAFVKIRLESEHEKKKKKPRRKLGDLSPGSLDEFVDTLKAVKKLLGRLRRRLLIKKLVLYYTSAGEDPSKVALQFGAANAVFGVVVPILDRHFRIKRRDLRAAADFNAKEPGIYALLSLSIAVWESFYVLFALMPVFTAMGSKMTKAKSTNAKSVINVGKDGRKDGEGTDKQPDGHDNGENQGDDRS